MTTITSEEIEDRYDNSKVEQNDTETDIDKEELNKVHKKQIKWIIGSGKIHICPEIETFHVFG